MDKRYPPTKYGMIQQTRTRIEMDEERRAATEGFIQANRELFDRRARELNPLGMPGFPTIPGERHRLEINRDHRQYRYYVEREDLPDDLTNLPSDSGEMYLYQPIAPTAMLGARVENRKMWEFKTSLPASITPDSICKIRVSSATGYYKTRTFICTDTDVYELVDGAYVALNCGLTLPRYLRVFGNNLVVAERNENVSAPARAAVRMFNTQTNEWSTYGGNLSFISITDLAVCGEAIYICHSRNAPDSTIWVSSGSGWSAILNAGDIGGNRWWPESLTSDGENCYCVMDVLYTVGYWGSVTWAYYTVFYDLSRPPETNPLLWLRGPSGYWATCRGAFYDANNAAVFTGIYNGGSGEGSIYRIKKDSEGNWSAFSILSGTSDKGVPVCVAAGEWNSYLSNGYNFYRLVYGGWSMEKIHTSTTKVTNLAAFEEQILAMGESPFIYHSEWEQDYENGWTENAEKATVVKGASQRT